MFTRVLFCLCCVGLTLAPLHAADEKKPKVAFLTPEAGGPDFLIQGEYLGTIGNKTPVGAQVVAKGDGKFDVVLFANGLPGEGWDNKTKVQLTGELKKSVTQLTGRNFTGQIRDGVMTGTAEEDVTYRLYKIFRRSPTLGEPAPEGAVVLFDGTDVEAWENAKLEEGNLLGVGGRTKQKFANFTLHLEFRTPFMPAYSGQARGNSGMYLLDQYECQILDSFGLAGLDNDCGGIYKASAPAVNMCLPPLSWQTYDVEFTSAKFDDAGKKVQNAVVKIRHNGKEIHKELSLPGPTPGGHQSDEKAGALFLQNHGDPVRFKNIWIVPKN